ncbi:MAG: hypothetical protein LV480_11185 [Methylacidiphilales bacterium]|nr:hypothetical protein [Candidatus Methylacidiphilales bacterium]
MNPLISIPRDALAELLRASGSALTPEEYVASLPEVSTYKKYPSRAWAAGVSKYCILVVAVLAVVCVPFLGFSIENLIIAAGLVTVTFFEYRVHRYFRENNPKAPSLGFRNQAAFAATILIYCLYHAIVPAQIPSDYSEVMDPSMLVIMQGFERVFYLIIAIVAGGSQFGLAWYYRNAQV